MVMVSSVLFAQATEDLHPQMVKQARRSGQLNLSNRGLVSVPDKVCYIVGLLSLVKVMSLAGLETGRVG